MRPWSLIHCIWDRVLLECSGCTSLIHCIGDRVLLECPGCTCICGSPVSTSGVLWSQACGSSPTIVTFFLPFCFLKSNDTRYYFKSFFPIDIKVIVHIFKFLNRFSIFIISSLVQNTYMISTFYTDHNCNNWKSYPLSRGSFCTAFLWLLLLACFCSSGTTPSRSDMCKSFCLHYLVTSSPRSSKLFSEMYTCFMVWKCSNG